MARKPRIEFPGALYHVFARGNHKNKIFLEPKDYQKYLDLINRYKKHYKFKFYAYALMSNHVHLLIETADVSISKVMQGLQQTYTQFFNWKYGKVGHLFQGRYRAIICQKDSYLLELIRYIHLNPIRAHVVKNLTNYPWTGHSYYLRDTKDRLVDTNFVLQQFGRTKTTARKYYQQFIKDGIGEGNDGFIMEIVDQRILGNNDFVEEILEIKDKTREDEKLICERLELKKILDIICSVIGIMPKAVKSNVKVKRVVWARRLFSFVARVYFGYQLKEIASYLGIDITTVTKNIRKIGDYVQEKKSFDKDFKRILEEIGAVEKEERLECQA